MSNNTSHNYSSSLHCRNQESAPEFGHPTLNWLGQDLLELGFGLGFESWARWTAVGFSCGLRLASAESEHAKKLLRERPTETDGANMQDALVLQRLAQRPFAVTDELTKMRAVFIKLLTEPPAEVQSELTGLDLGQQLAWWFRHSIVLGLKAGLSADSLFTGRMLGFLDTLPLNQHFISDRLIHILRAGERPRRPALIELVDYSYPATPLERMTIVELAAKVLGELSQREKPHEIADWILCGFREGLLLSARNAPLCNGLFAEAKREGMQTVRSLFVERIGSDPAGWQPQRLVSSALAWLREVHPNLATPNSRPAQFERIRQLFDFSFWMGLAAGAGDGAPG